ncbi:ABC transporter permease [Cellulomonas massiliensis]|uniref:ABC transporter permease n=1 Tax=Cellulomonas massiliensis TaxID=1465811 RepID=UPI0002EA6528|nr:ABC transporter permease [Cellulomonas massiliensis]
MSTTTTGPSGSVPLSSGRAIRLVAGREVRTRLQSKAFVWTTVAFVAVIVLGGVVLNLVTSSGTQAKAVGVLSDVAAVAPALEASATAVGQQVETRTFDDRAAGEAAVRDGEVVALVAAVSPSLEVVVKQTPDQQLAPAFGALAQQLALTSAVEQLGGDPAQVAQQVATAVPTTTSLEPAPETDAAQVVAGIVAGILLFVSIMTAGQLVAQGVVEEKSSRVVELLLATVRPWQLMAGKVLGIGLIGLLQVVLIVAAGAGTAFGLGLVETSSLDLGATALWSLVWFVVGFATYAVVLAGLAALVSRQEDVGAVVAPVTTVMIVPYVVGISIAPYAPDNPLVAWLSYVPFCAPMVMPIRIALGAVEPWQALLSVGLSVALIPLLVWFAGRVYSRGVLRSGGRMKLSEALRGA